VIEYLKDENRALREQLGGRRLRFTDAQRRRLARTAKPLERRRLRELSPIVTPETFAGTASSSPRSMTGARDAVRVDLGSLGRFKNSSSRWRATTRAGATPE